MARRNRVRQVTEDVAQIKETIDDALDRGVHFVYDGKDNRMNNDDQMTVAEQQQAVSAENVEAVDPRTVEPQRGTENVETVNIVDSPEAEANAEQADVAEEDAQAERTEKLREYSVDELKAMGVPASAIPRNARTFEPDRVVSEEEARRAAASPDNSFVADGQGDDEVVG